MSALPPNGVVRFAGEPSIFYMAICRDCDMAMPFDCAAARDQWARLHGDGTEHGVEKAVDVRPAPNDWRTDERTVVAVGDSAERAGVLDDLRSVAGRQRRQPLAQRRGAAAARAGGGAVSRFLAQFGSILVFIVGLFWVHMTVDDLAALITGQQHGHRAEEAIA